MSWTNPELNDSYEGFVTDVERRLGYWEDEFETPIREAYDKGLNVTQACKYVIDYFEDRMDADGDSEGIYPNKAMQIFSQIQNSKI